MPKKLYVDVETVMHDFDISKPKAYAIIHELNEELKNNHPSAIVIAGKVNRYWYDQACLRYYSSIEGRDDFGNSITNNSRNR